MATDFEVYSEVVGNDVSAYSGGCQCGIASGCSGSGGSGGCQCGIASGCSGGGN